MEFTDFEISDDVFAEEEIILEEEASSEEKRRNILEGLELSGLREERAKEAVAETIAFVEGGSFQPIEVAYPEEEEEETIQEERAQSPAPVHVAAENLSLKEEQKSVREKAEELKFNHYAEAHKREEEKFSKREEENSLSEIIEETKAQVSEIENSPAVKAAEKAFSESYVDYSRKINALGRSIGDRSIAERLLKPEYHDSARAALKQNIIICEALGSIIALLPEEEQKTLLNGEDSYSTEALLAAIRRVGVYYAVSKDRIESLTEDRKKAEEEAARAYGLFRQEESKSRALEDKMEEESEEKEKAVFRNAEFAENEGIYITNDNGQYLAKGKGRASPFTLYWSSGRASALKFKSRREASDYLDLLSIKLMGISPAGLKPEKLKFKGYFLKDCAFKVKAWVNLPKKEAYNA